MGFLSFSRQFTIWRLPEYADPMCSYVPCALSRLPRQGHSCLWPALALPLIPLPRLLVTTEALKVFALATNTMHRAWLSGEDRLRD